ncbi:uncharacterized protein LOC128243607 [Mya arenaria]|uniref:uncharacterized protein LOC128243607 n=1 Tax=Mya arenaria TaxID=6604 RepID=UPI0022E6E10C|nr:uncharacterized protein LOC128243607 [Mya arenaria]
MLRQEFNKVFQRYSGTQTGDVFSEGLNTLFIVLDCCGVQPISTFRNDFQALQTGFWINVQQRGPQVIPYSCCREATLGTYKYAITTQQALQCTAGLQPALYRTRGCYETFRKLATDMSTGAIVVTVLLIITEILAIISAVIMIRGIDRDRKDSLDPSNPKWNQRHEIALPDSKPR